MKGLVVTFYSTAEAMRAEEVFRDKAIPGRIIPVPPKIYAECGLAWRTTTDMRDAITAMDGKDIKTAGILEYDFRF